MANDPNHEKARLMTLLEDSEREVRNLKERLRQATSAVIARAERLQRQLDADQHVDGNGVIQSAGPEVDKLCARYEAAIEYRNRLRWALGEPGAILT